jgi:hypothetical protein
VLLAGQGVLCLSLASSATRRDVAALAYRRRRRADRPTRILRRCSHDFPDLPQLPARRRALSIGSSLYTRHLGADDQAGAMPVSTVLAR